MHTLIGSLTYVMTLGWTWKRSWKHTMIALLQFLSNKSLWRM